nr:tRNA (N(6)-L-threonylcarbamoyladenosine(37)-C(2))-methylthiotransferase MtaB [Rhodothermaceae bacterium]
HFQPHFHIPLQSGDDFVLGKMRRRYRKEVYKDRVTYIKRMLPHACIGADVIVGFPAEDEQGFNNTVQFIEDLPLSYLHVFTYSERPETIAVKQVDQHLYQPVPKGERSRRNKVLRLLSDKKRSAFYTSHKGQTRPVLWEKSKKQDRMLGFTDNYIKVERPFDSTRAHTIDNVRLGTLLPSGCMSIEETDYISLI